VHVGVGDGHAVLAGLGGRELGVELAQAGVAVQHELGGRLRGLGHVLRDLAQAPLRRDGELSTVLGQAAVEQGEQAGLAGAIASDKADFFTGVDGDGGAVQQHAGAAAQGNDYPSDCARAGLPPAMPVPSHGAKPWYQALDRLYAHALHHGLGELDLALEALGIGFGAGDGDLAAFLLQQGDDLGLPEHLLQCRAQPLDDGLGRGGRHGHTAPGREVDVGHAQLGQGLHLGQLGVALGAGNGQRHQPARQHLGIGHGKQRGAEGHLLAQHGIDQLGRALVGHMVDLQAHAGGQHLHAQVRWRAHAARGIVQRARPGLGAGGQVIQRAHARVGMHDDQDVRARHAQHMAEVLEHVVAGAFVHAHGGGHGEPEYSRRLGHDARGRVGAGAGQALSCAEAVAAQGRPAASDAAPAACRNWRRSWPLLVMCGMALSPGLLSFLFAGGVLGLPASLRRRPAPAAPWRWCCAVSRWCP
ncbi:unnamed protein product, partial [Ilex paraguariensis]